ncbi:MAG: hypothetical protein U0164_23940 [Gemmatimonadaceae bacterium]
MSARTRRRGATRQSATRQSTSRHSAARAVSALDVLPNADGRGWRALSDVQRAWWALGLAAGVVGMLGFQTFPPSQRLDAIERVNARQDSAFAAQAVEQRVALDTIRRQLGQLLAGQCAKERDGMARVLYGCGGR